METTTRDPHRLARRLAGEAETVLVLTLDGPGAVARRNERRRLRSVGDLRPEPATMFRGDHGAWRVAQELLGCAAIVALWVALWMWGAATLTQPWGPDPETRAALRGQEPAAVVSAGGAPAGR
jgi:hypothetical protein